EAAARDRLAAEGELGGGRCPHDRLVRREPATLGRPRRLVGPRREYAACLMNILVTGGRERGGTHGSPTSPLLQQLVPACRLLSGARARSRALHLAARIGRPA